jgi:hypothetical protein
LLSLGLASPSRNHLEMVFSCCELVAWISCWEPGTDHWQLPFNRLQTTFAGVPPLLLVACLVSPITFLRLRRCPTAVCLVTCHMSLLSFPFSVLRGEPEKSSHEPTFVLALAANLRDNIFTILMSIFDEAVTKWIVAR